MRIWLMNHYAASMFFDKAGRHYWFAKKLKERGYEPTVFCASTILNKTETVDMKGAKINVKKSEKIPFVFVETPQTAGNGLDRIKNMAAFYFGLFPASRAYAKKHERPDVILASSVHPLTMIAGIQIARRWRIPCICEIRDLWPEAIFASGKLTEKSILGKILTRGEHWIYKNADALIFTKEGDTDYLKEHRWTTVQGGDIALKKCHYINNGVDLAGYDKQIKEEIFADDDISDERTFKVVYTGTIRPTNNVDNILQCAEILKKQKGYEDVQFLIYGEGYELDNLRKYVTEKELDNVHLKGYVERKYIPYILSRSSVNLLNYSQSVYNWSRGNSSNKLFEYLASGKPVISTVKMGYSIIRKYGCGTELEECTPEYLANVICAYHDMPEEQRKKLGNNVRTAAEDFDFEKLTDKLESVIVSVVQE